MNLTGVRADTDMILDQWGDTWAVYRDTETWSGGVGTRGWALQGSITGDMQPTSGATMIAEESLQVKSEAEIVTVHDADVEVDDKIDVGGGRWMLVIYVKEYDGRKVVRAKRTEGMV